MKLPPKFWLPALKTKTKETPGKLSNGEAITPTAVFLGSTFQIRAKTIFPALIGVAGSVRKKRVKSAAVN